MVIHCINILLCYLIDPQLVILLVLGWYLLRIQYCVLSQNSDQFYYVQLNFFKWELDFFFLRTGIPTILYIDIENLLKFYSYVKHTGGYMCTCISKSEKSCEISSTNGKFKKQKFLDCYGSNFTKLLFVAYIKIETNCPQLLDFMLSYMYSLCQLFA